MNIQFIKSFSKYFSLPLLAPVVASIFLGTVMALGDGVHHWPTALACLWLGVTLHWSFHSLALSYKPEMESQGLDGQNNLWPPAVQTDSPPIKTGSWLGAVLFLSSLPAGLFIMIHGGKIMGYLLGGLYLSLLCFMILFGRVQNRVITNFLILLYYGPLALSLTYYSQSLEINNAVILAGLATGLFGVCINAVMAGNKIITELSGASLRESLLGKSITTDYLASLLSIPVVPVLVYFITQDHVYTLTAVGISILSVRGIKIFFNLREENSAAVLMGSMRRLLLIYVLLFALGWLR